MNRRRSFPTDLRPIEQGERSWPLAVFLRPGTISRELGPVEGSIGSLSIIVGRSSRPVGTDSLPGRISRSYVCQRGCWAKPAANSTEKRKLSHGDTAIRLGGKSFLGGRAEDRPNSFLPEFGGVSFTVAVANASLSGRVAPRRREFR